MRQRSRAEASRKRMGSRNTGRTRLVSFDTDINTTRRTMLAFGRSRTGHRMSIVPVLWQRIKLKTDTLRKGGDMRKSRRNCQMNIGFRMNVRERLVEGFGSVRFIHISVARRPRRHWLRPLVPCVPRRNSSAIGSYLFSSETSESGFPAQRHVAVGRGTPWNIIPRVSIQRLMGQMCWMPVASVHRLTVENDGLAAV